MKSPAIQSSASPSQNWTEAEWMHLCLMHRIISYLAMYHQLPLTRDISAEKHKQKLLDFYETYHLPFETLVKASESPIESLIDCPDQVYLFLSSLAQTYEIDWADTGISEEEAFLILFQEKDAQSLSREIPTQCIQLGFYTQMSNQLLICDPSTSREDSNLICLSGVEPGIWRAATQIVGKEDGEINEPAPAFLLAKSQTCPLSFQQIMEQAFLWPKKQNVFTDIGILGFFDEKYYQDPTLFGIPPLSGKNDRWLKVCSDLLVEYPNACILPHGVISCSGEGEGLYDAYYLKDTKGHIIAVALDFLLYGED